SCDHGRGVGTTTVADLAAVICGILTLPPLVARLRIETFEPLEVVHAVQNEQARIGDDWRGIARANLASPNHWWTSLWPFGFQPRFTRGAMTQRTVQFRPACERLAHLCCGRLDCVH